MRWKSDMAAIAANGRVFFVIIFTVSCIGVKTVSGYPKSSYNEDESDISTVGGTVGSTTTEPNFPLPPSLEEMAKKRDELMWVAKKVRRQYTTVMPPFLTRKKKGRKGREKLQNRKCKWRRAFRHFWKWLELQRQNRRQRKTKQRGTGGIPIVTPTKTSNSKQQDANRDWIQRNRLLLKQTLQKLDSYTNV